MDKTSQLETRSQFYHPIGDGRDSYISFNNGGMYPPHLPMPEYPVSSFISRRRVSPVSAESPKRTVRYYSNGTGRDNYISANAGGFESKTRNCSPGATFYKSLRESDGMLRSTFANGDFLQRQRQWLPLRQVVVLKDRAKGQKLLIERLAKPKVGGNR